MCEFNEKRLCWEYIRWNRRDGCFFATPIGALTLRETQAYVLQHLIENEAGADVAIEYATDRTSDSSAHVYTALLELFFRTFDDPQVNATDKMVTLITLIDMALQIPPVSYRGHPDWTPMTIPGLRFMTFFEHIREIGFVDHRDDAHYLKFTEDMSALLGWPSPKAIWHEFHQAISEMLSPIRHLVGTSIDADPAAFERYLDHRLRKIVSVGDLDPAAPAAEVEGTRTAFRENPLGYSGYLGVGVLEAIERALSLRLEQPIAFAFPQQQRFIDLLHAKLNPPILHYGGTLRIDLSAASLPLVEDIQGLRHLWAMTLQWSGGGHRALVCGNRLFGIACAEPACRQGRCPNWSPGDQSPGDLCTYTDVLTYYHLYAKREG
jgi:hypothetical protein